MIDRFRDEHAPRSESDRESMLAIWRRASDRRAAIDLVNEVRELRRELESTRQLVSDLRIIALEHARMMGHFKYAKWPRR